MFGAKARKIKALEELIALQEKNYMWKLEQQGRYVQEIKELKESIVGLTADRDAARSALDSLQNDFKILGSNHENRGGLLSSALADRDQFAKRVEELEQEALNNKAELQRLKEEFESSGRKFPAPGPAIN